ncbi:MAG: diversity-generating retroelement protein Avd [Clostridia bacterium]|nr:diversity-generating retroelement protein Avd [Clostridia bacterium]
MNQTEKYDNNIKKINTNNSKNNLIIYQKYLELIYYSNNLLKKYPRSETFALVQEIKNCLYGNLKNLMYAIKSYRIQEKLKYLNEFDINLSLLKIYIRLSYNYKYISLQNYTTWSNLITSICNMLGGWISSCQKR